MRDYRKVNRSHRLSGYRAKLPAWTGAQDTYQPFEGWGEPSSSLPWYQAYNRVKHSRHANFAHANLGNLVQAACALAVVYSAQFMREDGLPGFLTVTDPRSDGFEFACGGYFLIKFPTDWLADERYEFNWQTLSKEPEPFSLYTY
jgi:hypothetical protein